jgi:hypothetical protein
MSSTQYNAKSPGTTSTSQKSSIATKPLKTTPMQAFLTELKETTYGPVLAEIDTFVTEIVKEDDHEIFSTNDSFRNLVENNRKIDEKAITDWFDTVKNKLKPKILYARRNLSLSKVELTSS